MIGGTGNDTTNGGAGNDIITYTFGDGADTIDGGDDLDTLNIIGTAASNTLNVVYNDTRLTNFEGGTVVNVEAITADLSDGVDTLSYAGTTAGITVDLSTGFASSFTSIAGIENVKGGLGNNTLTGNGFANVLSGASGNDTFIAILNDGNDSLVGGSGVDTYDLSATTAAAIITTTGASSAEIGTDTLSSIENVIGGQGNDTITLGGGVNILDGQGGDDVLDGVSGNDTLVGGAGNDTLIGRGGLDTLVFNASGFGNDIVKDFIPAEDKLQFDPSLFNNYQAVIDSASQAPGSSDTTITSGNDSVTLLGVPLTALNSSNVHVG